MYKKFLEYDRKWFPLLVAEMPSFITRGGRKLQDRLIDIFEFVYLRNTSFEPQAQELIDVYAAGKEHANPPWITRDVAA